MADAEWVTVATTRNPSETAPVGHEDLKQLVVAVGADPDGSAVHKVNADVRQHLEREFISRGDDGLLEHLAHLGEESGDKRRKAVQELAQAVSDRQLFKLIGRAENDADRALAKEIYEKF